MLGKKKNLEEKMDTHVLNLQEIKEAARNEKNSKKQKGMPLLLFFLGLFMIVMGILYPIIQDTLQKDDSEVSKTSQLEKEAVKEKETASIISNLTCTVNETGTRLKKEIKDVYQFDEKGLVKVTTTTDLVAINETGKVDITTSATTFNSLYGSIEAKGIEKKANLATDGGALITILSIDFTKFNVEKYNKSHPDHPFFITYPKGTSKEEIQKTATLQGAVCQ